MLLKVIAIALLLFVPIPSVINAQSKRKPAPKQQVVYSCPMHPEVKSTKPGRCPKCRMELRPVDPKPTPSPSPTPPDDVALTFTSAKIPNTRILDQDGKQLNFYDDLIKGKTVAINFIFTTCTTVCPPLTATFRKIQQTASERGLDIKLVSVSVDPVVDTPERLRAFAEKFKIEQGWTFVTGDKGDMDSLLQSLGVAVTNKNDHTPMILIGNDPADYWTRAYGLSSPSLIIDLIAEAANHK
jgi:cytochrome oxidase Cu insertion factor (SCO1/SenC/PrrC family)